MFNFRKRAEKPVKCQKMSKKISKIEKTTEIHNRIKKITSKKVKFRNGGKSR